MRELDERKNRVMDAEHKEERTRILAIHALRDALDAKIATLDARNAFLSAGGIKPDQFRRRLALILEVRRNDLDHCERFIVRGLGVTWLDRLLFWARRRLGRLGE
jgi:hypothetical protein